MIRLFINGLAASAGGGLTYLRNLIPQLAARDDAEATLLLSPSLRREFEGYANVSFVVEKWPLQAARRFCWEQLFLPGLVRRARADVLVSAGNFALRNSPVPQILLSRNSLYTSPDFFRDLRRRREYTMWLDTHLKRSLARRSIAWADSTVAPSGAFARQLGRWTGKQVLTIPHGFDREAFAGDATQLPADVQQRLADAKDCLRLLFVSHYNYYRNFETLLRALPLLQDSLQQPVKLFLTCRLSAGQNPGRYRPEEAAALVRRLGTRGSVVELGPIPYGSLHHLYRACQIYVTPAYAESFAHPLLEAMCMQLPIVASDLAVHREICGPAALYFEAFSSAQLAEAVILVASSRAVASRLAENGRTRSLEFSWKKHTHELLALAASLCACDRATRQYMAA